MPETISNMDTYLFTWNPKRWLWDDLADFAEEINGYGSSIKRWSCGNTKKIQRGDRAFLIRLGMEPKGIIGSGVIVNRPYEALHWDKRKAEERENALYVDIEFDALINPADEPVFPRTTLATAPFEEMHWDAQSSGTTIPTHVASALEDEWRLFLKRPKSTNSQVNEQVIRHEGKLREISLTSYERDPEARRICLEYHGTTCQACLFNFEETYGSVGAGFIHVHHLLPLSKQGGEHEIDPVEDLIPVCPNCHAIIHRRDPPYTIEEIQKMLKQKI